MYDVKYPKDGETIVYKTVEGPYAAYGFGTVIHHEASTFTLYTLEIPGGMRWSNEEWSYNRTKGEAVTVCKYDDEKMLAYYAKHGTARQKEFLGLEITSSKTQNATAERRQAALRLMREKQRKALVSHAKH